MADVKWIKIVTDVFDDEKILLIETLPEADSIIVLWFKLLCLAGKQNNSGVFMLNDKMPYNEKMFATIFRRKEATVQLAFKTFEDFGMIEIINGAVTIPNWGKHQTLDRIEQKNEYMRNYMRDYREKQKLLIGNGKLCQNGLNVEDWKFVLNYFDYECAYCGEKNNLEQEHIDSVSNKGLYEIGNIVPACRRCNASKGNKAMEEWYSQQKFYTETRCQKILNYIKLCKTNVNVLRKVNVSEADKDIDKNKNKSKSNICAYFETFYSLYPRKVNKKKAQEKYYSILKKSKSPEETANDILEGLKKYIDFWEKEKTELQFIPHPTTWLNGERWNDDIISAKPKKINIFNKVVNEVRNGTEN